MAKTLFDRFETGTIERQKDEMGASGANGVARWLTLVVTGVVGDDDVALDLGRSENLLSIDRDERSIDGAR